MECCGLFGQVPSSKFCNCEVDKPEETLPASNLEKYLDIQLGFAIFSDVTSEFELLQLSKLKPALFCDQGGFLGIERWPDSGRSPPVV